MKCNGIRGNFRHGRQYPGFRPTACIRATALDSLDAGRSPDEMQWNPGQLSAWTPIPRIPAYGLHPGYGTR